MDLTGEEEESFQSEVNPGLSIIYAGFLIFQSCHLRVQTLEKNAHGECLALRPSFINGNFLQYCTFTGIS
jgi:hypothetical protein